jgi:hypothetical protein
MDILILVPRNCTEPESNLREKHFISIFLNKTHIWYSGRHLDLFLLSQILKICFLSQHSSIFSRKDIIKLKFKNVLVSKISSFLILSVSKIMLTFSKLNNTEIKLSLEVLVLLLNVTNELLNRKF